MTSSQNSKTISATETAKQTTGNTSSKSQAQPVKSNAQKATTSQQKAASVPAKKVSQRQSPAKNSSASTQHIADQIKTFPRRRVWPD